ncbi:MAG: hypothetical protein ACRDVZ_17385 [Jiangellaceae bacterium]
MDEVLHDTSSVLTHASMSHASPSTALPARGWVLAIVLSLLEVGYYGTDYVRDQSDIVREARVHLFGAKFGMRTIGRPPAVALASPGGRECLLGRPYIRVHSVGQDRRGLGPGRPQAVVRKSAPDTGQDESNERPEHLVCADRIWRRITDRSEQISALVALRYFLTIVAVSRRPAANSSSIPDALPRGHLEVS